MKIFLIAVLCWAAGCQPRKKNPEFGNHHISYVVSAMTDIMVHDVSNPPLAARFFSYACLAGYEVVSQNNSAFRSLHGFLNGYPEIKKPDSIKNFSYPLAALLAMMETAKKMQPSGKLLEKYQARFLDSCAKAGLPMEVIRNSGKYALYVSKRILSYASGDGYNRISNYSRYTPLPAEGAWFPTPPAYFAAVEPYFKVVRPFTLDTCIQFKPPPPVPFSTDKESAFYKLMLRNYQLKITAEQKSIAAYWDCNPFAVQDNGHLLVGLKKISPGAHWLGITGAACRKEGKSFDEAMQIFTVVSIGLMDAFISCWDEKYRSNRIRPETAIRKYLDVTWTPVLQTPPFPEYVSGHSTISAASAAILSHYFGESFHFTDSTEMRYGLGTRSFTSFQQAAEQAAISRFYGGIHFMDAITNGLDQGSKIGAWVLAKVPVTGRKKPGFAAARKNF